MRRSADEQVVEGIVSVRAHYDVGGVVIFRGVDDLSDGRAVNLLGLDDEIRVAAVEVIGDFSEALGRIFFTHRNGFLEVLQSETVITRKYRWLHNVQEENSALRQTGKGACGIDHTLRGGREIDRGKDRFHNIQA